MSETAQKGWGWGPLEPSYFIILLDRARPEELNAVHVIVRTHASKWWHQLEHAWIVEGFDASYWMTLCAAVLAMNDNSGVVVFPLPTGQPRMSFRGPGYLKKMEWLRTNGIFSWDTPETPDAGQLHLPPPLDEEDDVPF